jgi:hypothetical protein
MRWFWTEGRFSWPLVGSILFLSSAMVLTDLAWRTLVIPVESLIASVAGVGVVAVLIFIGVLATRRKRSS